MMHSLFISCARGLEYLLETEVKSLGLLVEKVSPQGVYGQASLATLYQLCLWSRIANRVHIILFSGEVIHEKSLYQLCADYHWQTVFSAQKTFAIEFHGSSEHIRHSIYGAQVMKDGIVDSFRRVQGHRPSVDTHNPDIRLHAYLKHDQVTVSLDATGYSLHQRGYRTEAGEAPLKETLAAALLMRAGFARLVKKEYAFHDPFCGSGTLVIEAAMMAACIAPGLIRSDQAFKHWVLHEPSLWGKIRHEALSLVKPTKSRLVGTDVNPQMITIAKANAERAGVLPLVQFDVLPLKDCKPVSEKGLLACNPPYGERLDNAMSLMPLYQEIGSVAHHHFPKWELALLTSNPLLAKAVGLRAHKQYTLYNGQLACKLYCMTLDNNQLKNNQSPEALTSGAQMFLNRLKKNYQHLEKWVKRDNIHAYRVYDADLPEYAFAIDFYNDTYAVLQEYKPPLTVDSRKAQQRSLEVLQVVPLVLNIQRDHLIIKERKPQKGVGQYQKLSNKHENIVVIEGRAQLLVNLYDYLDTGLFLDNRPLRLQFASLPKDTRFLNCFCYTASASVHAALAGAITTNVDLSNTYLKWAENNFRQNHIDLKRHQFIQFDCFKWLAIARDRFDVILLDPPSFSNSKRMEGTLDIQRDHVSLIQSAIRLLKPTGILYFVTNLRTFKLNSEIEKAYNVKNITAQTIPLDFKRNARIHHCYQIMLKSTDS